MWLCLALVVVTLSVYWQVSGHGFISFDDTSYVTENPHVFTGLSGANIIWAFTSVEVSNWHPLTWLSLMIDVELYGLNAGGHHLTSVAIHAMAAVLLLWLLVEMTGAIWQSALVAALFALHPMHVESVAWAAERKDVLSAAFWFLTLLLYAKYAETGKRKAYWLTLVSFVLCLMSKPMGVMLPIVMLLLDIWPLKRVEGLDIKRWLPLVKEKLPFFALSLLSSAVTIYAQNKSEAIISIDVIPYGIRIENAAISTVTYIGQLLWPRDLAVFYPYSFELPLWKFIGSLGILVTVTAWVLRKGRRYPYLLIGWLWFLITLVPVIGLVQVGEQSMADRYTYIPYTGLFLMVVWGMPELTKRVRYRQALHGVLAGLALLGCTALTWQQIGYWRDGISLFRHALQVTTNSSVVHNGLGLALQQKGDTDAAVKEYREALAMDPYSHEPHTNLGVVLAEKGDMIAAIGEFQAALVVRPNDYNSHNNLGLAFVKSGELDAAIQTLREAIAINPSHDSAHNNLGMALAGAGDLQAAIGEYRKALAINPNSDSAHGNLGAALAGRGDMEGAIGEFQAAVAIKPNDFEAHYNLGQAFRIMGDPDAAISEFREAVRLNPESVQAQRELSAALSQRGPSRSLP